MRTGSLGIGAFALMLILGALTASAATGRESASSFTLPHEVRVITQNIAGAAMFEGRAAALDRLLEEVARRTPDVVMLQEVCASQADRLRESLPGWSVEFTVAATRGSHCPRRSGHIDPSGEVLASPWVLRDVVRTVLGPGPERTSRVTHLTCADLVIPLFAMDALRACTTHLRPWGSGAKIRERQTRRIKTLLRGVVRSGRQGLIVGGDFNAAPGRRELDPMYRVDRRGRLAGGHGLFLEGDQFDRRYFQTAQRYADVRCAPRVCRSGRGTYRNRAVKRSPFNIKLDYVFWSHTTVEPTSLAAECRASDSDHCLYRSSATVRLRTLLSP